MVAIPQTLKSASLGSALALSLFGPESHVLRKTFKVAAGGRLVVGATAGSVRVSAREIDVVEVEVRRTGLLPPPLLEIEQDGDDVYVQARSLSALQWLTSWSRRGLELEVNVPARYSVDVQTTDARIQIEDVQGEVEARSLRGRLAFRNVAGSIEGRTAGGSIDVDGCQGDIELHSAGGPIRIEDSHGDVMAHASGGAIRVS